MNEQVAWQVELHVRPGKLQAFRALTEAMIEATRAEAGVLNYERFISADGQTVHVYERYENSAAAVAHLQMFRRQFGAQFRSMVERKHFHVYGTPGAELRSILDEFGAVYLQPFGGFCRPQSSALSPQS